MELRRTKLIQQLREAREELLNINFATDTSRYYRAGIGYGNVSNPYGLVDDWLNKWNPMFVRFNAFPGGYYLDVAIRKSMEGYEQETDVEIFNELRPIFVGRIDMGLSILDQKYEVKPLLEDYTKRIKDTKLAELIKEFNASKDIASNLVAMGFRTILSLIIQEKAKRVNPTSNTATCTDLAPREMIDRARNDNILSPDEQRLVNSFVSTHQDIYNFVAHRPNVLIDKSEVCTAPIRLDTNSVIVSECWSAALAAPSIGFQTRLE